MSSLAPPFPSLRGAAGRSVLFLLLALYTATFVGLPDNPDSEVEFQTASSLAHGWSLALDPNVPLARLAIEAGHGVRAGGPGREHESFAWFGVGQAFVALPFWYAGFALDQLLPRYETEHRESTWYGAPQNEYFEHLLVGWRNPLLGALTGWLVALASARLGARRAWCWSAGLGYGLCTFAWPQAVSTLSDVQATFLLFLAFCLLLGARAACLEGRRPRPLVLAGAGLALAGALLTRVASVPAVCVLLAAALSVLVLVRRRCGGRQALRCAALVYGPFALGLILFLALNRARFGDPLETGYGGAVSGSFFSYPPLQGLAALLGAPGKGLLWMAPGVLLFPLALVRARGAGAWPLLVALGVTLATFALVAPTQGWHGAHTYGPRYLLPALPFLWLGVAPVLDAARGKARLLACALVLAGLATSLPGVLVSYATHLDLATRAASLAWSDEELGLSGANADEERFQRIQWRWAFAAPWAHWRILCWRVRERNDDFPLAEIFFQDDDVTLTPTHERTRGFRHLAWVDFHQRLGGPLWPAFLLCGTFLALGLASARTALTRGEPAI